MFSLWEKFTFVDVPSPKQPTRYLSELKPKKSKQKAKKSPARRHSKHHSNIYYVLYLVHAYFKFFQTYLFQAFLCQHMHILMLLSL